MAAVTQSCHVIQLFKKPNMDTYIQKKQAHTCYVREDAAKPIIYVQFSEWAWLLHGSDIFEQKWIIG